MNYAKSVNDANFHQELQLLTNYVVDTNGCHLWQGSTWFSGYGRLPHKSHSTYPARAHVASFMLHNNVDKPIMYVCHSCDVKTCINPKHLWLGTNKDNQLDASRKGLLQKAWTADMRKAVSRRCSGQGNPMSRTNIEKRKHNEAK